MTSMTFLLTLGIVALFCLAVAVTLTYLLSSLAAWLRVALYRIGLVTILGAGVQSALLLFEGGSFPQTKTVIVRIVLMLVTGLALFLESGYQMSKKSKASDPQNT